MEKNVKATTKKVTKAVKPVIENNDLNESFDKVVATAKNVNNQIKETVSVIAEDIKEATQDIKEATQDIKAVATKSAKEVSKKVDFSKSVKKVKSTAKSVNSQLAETASEIADEVKEKGKELKSATAKLAKEAMDNANVNDRIKSIKKAAKNANDFALQTSDTLIDAFVENSGKWQNVTEKAIKSGLKLAERQQSIVFNALEAVKVQLGGSAVRFKKLFQNK